MSTDRSAPSKHSMKRAWVGFTIIGSGGLLVAIVLTIIEGVKYRLREDQGLDPIYAPEWVAVSTYAGLWVFALALAGLAVTGVVALIRR
jgi:hypothetical protein